MEIPQEELIKAIRRLGENTDIDEEDLPGYFPDISNTQSIRDFYLPRIGPGFYLGDTDMLRRLSWPFSGKRMR